MKQSNFLSIDVRLMLARYGRALVLKAIAEALRISEGDLEAELTSAIEKPVPTARKAPFAVSELKIDDPDILSALLALEGRYKNRTFLPELRDVNRFLERNGRPGQRMKSRVAAQKRVFETLLKFRPADLAALVAFEEPRTGFSSLGVISDHIMSRHGDSGGKKE